MTSRDSDSEKTKLTSLNRRNRYTVHGCSTISRNIEAEGEVKLGTCGRLAFRAGIKCSPYRLSVPPGDEPFYLPFLHHKTDNLGASSQDRAQYIQLPVGRNMTILSCIGIDCS